MSLLHRKEGPAGLQRSGDQEAEGGRGVASGIECRAETGGRVPGEQPEGLVALPGGPCVAGGRLFPHPGTGQRLSGVRRNGEEKRKGGGQTAKEGKTLRAAETPRPAG